MLFGYGSLSLNFACHQTIAYYHVYNDRDFVLYFIYLKLKNITQDSLKYAYL